jgi:hypothetical protein
VNLFKPPYARLRQGQPVTRALLIDTRRGAVKITRVTSNRYTRDVTAGRFSGGQFKANGLSVKLAGDLGCSGRSGAGRQLEIAANPMIFFEALRLRGFNNDRRKGKPVSSTYIVRDNCDRTSSVTTLKGRVFVTPFSDGAQRQLPAGVTFRAHPRR